MLGLLSLPWWVLWDRHWELRISWGIHSVWQNRKKVSE